MPQDQASGEAGRQFGAECGERLPELLGARRLGSRSNECVWDGKRTVIKCAQLKSTSNPTIGVLADMLGRIDAVIAAFQVKGQEFELWWMSAEEYVLHSRLKPADEKRTKDQRMINRSSFVAHAEKIRTVVFDPPLTSISNVTTL